MGGFRCIIGTLGWLGTVRRTPSVFGVCVVVPAYADRWAVLYTRGEASGRSAAEARLLWEQEVASSILAASTSLPAVAPRPTEAVAPPPSRRLLQIPPEFAD